VARTFLHAACPDHFSLALVKHTNARSNHIAFDMFDLDSSDGGGRPMPMPVIRSNGRGPSGPQQRFAYSQAGGIPLEYTSDVLQIDDTYVPAPARTSEIPPGRSDQWGVTNPQTARLGRNPATVPFSDDGYRT